MIVFSKNISVSATALTDAAAGDGVTGFLYGDARPLYELKKFLVDQLGYVVTVSSTRTSGTGTVANAVSSSDLWTSGYAVAYQESYCGLRAPSYRGVARRLLLQRGDSFGNFGRFKINRTADYGTSGGATAVRPQTIAGEKLWLGTGTDTSRGYAAALPGVDLTLQFIGDTSTGGFVAVGYPPAGTAVGGTGFFLALDPFLDGTYESGADDATLIYLPQTTPTWADLSSESGACRAWSKLGLSGADFVGVSMRCALGIGSSPASPRTGNKPLADIWYGRDASPAELLGKSSLFQAYGPVGSVPRTAKVSTTKDRIVIGQLVTQWDGTEPS